MQTIQESQLDTTKGEHITGELLEQAFHTWYEGLHRYAYTLLNDNEAAKDAVQQVFFNLWEKRDKLNIRLSIKPYLYRAVYHYCMNRQTREQRHAPLPDDNMGISGYDGIELLAETRELRTLIERTIAALPPQCKTIFLKSRVEEKTYPDIAREGGISVKTVEAQISKALKILRTVLNHYQSNK